VFIMYCFAAQYINEIYLKNTNISLPQFKIDTSVKLGAICSKLMPFRFITQIIN
jgi:hypothetical protein